TRPGKHERGSPRRRQPHVHAHATIRGLAAQLFANGFPDRGTHQPLEAADVNRHEIVAMPLVARRKFLGNRQERAGHLTGCTRGCLERRRLVETRIASAAPGIGLVTHRLGLVTLRVTPSSRALPPPPPDLARAHEGPAPRRRALRTSADQTWGSRPTPRPGSR